MALLHSLVLRVARLVWRDLPVLSRSNKPDDRSLAQRALTILVQTKNLTLEEVTQLFDRDEVPGISGMEQRERQLSESIASESIDATSMRKV